MSLFDKLLRGFGYEKAPTAGAVQKSAGFMDLEIESEATGTPDSEKTEEYSDFIEAYKKLPWLYAGATALAVAGTKPPLKVYRERKKGGKIETVEVQGESINGLIRQPNQFLSQRELLQLTLINLCITGNGYWNLVGMKDKQPIAKSNLPVELWWMKPGQVEVDSDKDKFIKSYTFTTKNGRPIPLDPSEVIHFRLPNPDSYFYGLGMVEPAKDSAIQEFYAVAYNKNFMRNDAVPPLVFKHPGNIEDVERKRFLAAWRKDHAGPNRKGRIGFLWGGIEIDKIGNTPKDAEYSQLKKMNREEQLATLGVPPSVVGLLEYANYSNMEVQNRKFWLDTVIPILGFVSDKLTLNLAPLFGDDLYFAFDYSKIPALQEDEEKKSRVARALIGCGIKTPNDIIREYYKGEGYAGGDQHYMEMGLIPIGEAGEPAVDAKSRTAKRLRAGGYHEHRDEGGEKRKPSFWQDPDHKKALWEGFSRRVGARERGMTPAVEKYLKEQARAIKEKLDNLSDINISPDKIFDDEAEIKRYVKEFRGRYLAAFKQAGDAGLDATNGKVYLLPDERKALKDDEPGFEVSTEHLEKLKKLINSSAQYFNTTTWDWIDSMIKKAQAENWTAEQFTQEIWGGLNDMAITRARLIAHTESAKVENWGILEGYKQNEFVTQKVWLCSMLSDSREAHIEADRRYSDDPIDINADFEVDGEMLAYPGDPRGSAGNVCECKCSTYPVVGDL